VYLRTRSIPPPKSFSIPEIKSTQQGKGGNSESLFAESPRVSIDQGLESWHETFESTVLDFIEFADGFIGSIDEGKTSEEMKGLNILEAMEATQCQMAASEHPSPEMGAELSAFLATLSASLHAYVRGDTDLSNQQRSLYGEYREMWFQRLRQFPQDLDRIIRLRRV
tara:strand:+ start:1071 stop:1571 length:501 start_codon:yes stop_codon:yes gene_type:complete